MRRLLPRSVALAVVLLVVGAIVPAFAARRDYSDPAWVQEDVTNMSRSSGRHTHEFLTPEYGQAFLPEAVGTWTEAQGAQVRELPQGRIRTGGGQVVPGGSVGDPRHDREGSWVPVSFLSRTGAKLNGRVWLPAPTGPSARHPGIVITTGSIQGYERMYWWAARALAQAGYVVMTWDVQGQGQSEGFGHRPGSPVPTTDGFPAQQEANFVDGTVDALRFFLSTPDAPYTTGTVDDGINRWNPVSELVDPTHLGLAGHSLGATAVSKVQQCKLARLAAQVCGGVVFPGIRAVVAWDALLDSVTPVVPAMDQEADGYFLFPTPSPQAPDPDGHLAAKKRWEAAGLPVYAFSIRGGTHLEWTDVPYILPATAYGRDLARFYTVAWFDRWVRNDATAMSRLLDGPRVKPEQAPQSGDNFSTRYRSGFWFSPQLATNDLRAWAGFSPVPAG